MNTKASLLATAATLGLFSAAHADTTNIIDITGSTAGRSAIHTLLSSPTGPLGATVKFKWYKIDGSTAAAGSQDGAIYKADNGVASPNKVTTIVRTFWAGSASGVEYVSNQTQLDNKFLATTVDTTTANAQLAGNAATLQSGGQLAPASVDTVAEFGFSDVKQASTPHQANPLAEQTDMFIIPFKWVKTSDAGLSSVTDITDQMARAFYTAGGETKKSLFTGLTADYGTLVYAVGRDADSGTRITALAETGAGAFATLTQWGFTVTDTGVTAPTAGFANDDTISAPFEMFDGGYASGGSVANILSGSGFNAIGYLGVSDAATAITQGAVELTFNGVPFSVTNIVNGRYTFWSKYQAIRKQNLAVTNPAAATLFTSVKNALTTSPTTANGSLIKLSDMKCTRAADGADVLPN